MTSCRLLQRRGRRPRRGQRAVRSGGTVCDDPPPLLAPRWIWGLSWCLPGLPPIWLGPRNGANVLCACVNGGPGPSEAGGCAAADRCCRRPATSHTRFRLGRPLRCEHRTLTWFALHPGRRIRGRLQPAPNSQPLHSAQKLRCLRHTCRKRFTAMNPDYWITCVKLPMWLTTFCPKLKSRPTLPGAPIASTDFQTSSVEARQKSTRCGMHQYRLGY
jgi:hypothetical protein